MRRKKNCEHEWDLVDDGAGTIVKSNKKMYWGHKASIIGFPEQGIALDMIPVADASTNDGKTIYPHIKKLLENYPELKGKIDTFLYDSAADIFKLKKRLKKDFRIELKASFHPRRKKEITEGLPKGILKLTPYGYPVCLAGYELEYQGVRKWNKKYIYKITTDTKGNPLCCKCKYKNECCPNSTTGRTVNISFELLPHINSEDPPMAKRFKALMSKRPAVERMIKRLKCDLSDDRLSKAGNVAFKAYLDKTMIGYQILIRHE
jgi:hypothetical protein